MPELNFIFYFYGFFIAASIASFYTTLGERILKYFYSPLRKQNSFFKKWKIIFTKPSACEKCSANVKAINLIPIFGYYFSSGKCKNCGIKISNHYPFIELIFGILFCIFFFFTNNLFFSFLVLFLFGHVLVSMITDYRKFSLDYENLPFIICLGITSNYALLNEFPSLVDLGVLLGFFFFFLALWFFYPKGIGLGDVIFAPVYAFLSGNPYWIVFLNSSYIFAILWAYLTLKKGESIRHKPIPMGTFFGLGLTLAFCAKAYFFQSMNYE